MPAITSLTTSVTFAENAVNATPALLDADVAFTSPTSLAGGRLLVRGLLAEDRVSILAEGSGAGQIGLSGTTVTFGGVAIGTVAGGLGGDFTVTFTASATATAVDALIQRLAYANVSGAPTGTRTLTLDVLDQTGNSLGGIGTLTELTDTDSPFLAPSVSFPDGKPRVAFLDLDHDGDLDLISGNRPGRVETWFNTGSAAAPVFTSATGTANPFNAVSLLFEAVPSVVDLDGDGDLDVVLANAYGQVEAWRNTGTSGAPAFTRLSGTENPFASLDLGSDATPAFFDLDGDGDLDLVSGFSGGTLRAWRNTGSATVPAGFTELTGAANPFNGITVGSGQNSAPSFVDLDGDGNLDLVVGNYSTLQAWRNTGTQTAPAFTALTGADNPFASFTTRADTAAAFVDLDGDGDLDVAWMVGVDYPFVRALRNTANPLPAITVTVTAEADAPAFTSGSTASFAEGGTGTVYQAVATDPEGAAVTWSLEGADAALFVIDGTGAVRFVAAPDFEAPADAGRNNVYDITVIASDGTLTASRDVAITVTDGNDAPEIGRFLPVTSPADPLAEIFAGFDFGLITTPAFTDLDGDGDLDLVVGNLDGTLRAFERTESGFVALTGTANPLDGIAVASGSAPVFADLDGDGDLDLVVGQVPEGLSTWERTADGFQPLTGSANPFDGFFTGETGVRPAFTDLDGDDDLDLVVGDGPGALRVWIQSDTGFVEATGSANPFDGILFGNLPAPAFTDLDGDGDLDLVVGNSVGLFRAWQRTDTGFVELAGAANPFAAIGANRFASPALTDLDGDGDLDLVSGELRTLSIFANLGDGIVAVEGATGVILTPPVRDPNGDPISWSLSGDDAASFTIDGTTGALAFRAGPDFEAPRDQGADNIYRVTLVASDGSLSSGLDVVVRVTDAEEAPVIAGPVVPSFALRDPTPFAGIEAGFRSAPVLVDLDGDGDLDVVVGDGYGALRTWQQTGTGFVELTDTANPFAGIGLGDFGRPAFVALGADGKLDLVAGSRDGTLRVWERTVSSFVEVSGAANPFDGIDVGTASAPAFTDLDGDGDLDLVVGESGGALRAWQRTPFGFLELTGGTNPFAGIDVGSNSAPAFADLDRDGDLDLVAGSSGSALRVWQRTGATFAELTGTANPFAGMAPGTFSTPFFADLDGDGNLDLVLGESGGTVSALTNRSFVTRSVAEGTTGVVFTPTATDGDGDALTWSLSGADAALFDIDVATGAVSFRAAPEFEAPTDAGANNMYDIVVRAFDGSATASLGVAITVTTENDAPTGAVTLGLQAGATPLTVSNTLADADGLGAVTYRWQWLDGASWVDIAGATGTTFAPTGTQAGLVRAVASYTDGGGTVEQVASTLVARIGADAGETLTAASGEAALFGLGGDDSLAAGNDAALIDGGFGRDTLAGGLGNDKLIGGRSNDRLEGNGGNDSLDGGSGNDLLLGGNGDDTLSDVAGADTLDGGSGNDAYFVDNAGDVVSEAGGSGIDLVVASVSRTLAAGIENLQLAGTTGLNGTGNALDNRLQGNTGANVLAGAEGADTLLGSAGNDTLAGGDGDDRLDGGSGADSVDGGAGNDTYLVDNAGDMAREADGSGIDLVIAGVSHTLAAGIEYLQLVGTAALNGTGNALDNLLQGNAGANGLAGGEGADTLEGGTGNDTLRGGAGNDSLVGGSGRDLADYADATGSVTVTLGRSGVLGAAAGGGIGGDTLSGDIENLRGSAFDDTLTGAAFVANVIDGGEGNDRIEGVGTSDTLTGGNGADIFVFGAFSTSNLGFVTDFSTAQGDRIDLRPVDAIAGTGANDAFIFATDAFTGAGQVRVVQSGANTLVEFNTSGADSAEAIITLQNVLASTVTAGVFDL